MARPVINDQTFLREQQYCDASNLNARLAIHQRFSANKYGWVPFVQDALASLPADAQILELGCGPATLWSAALNRVPSGWRIVLTDFSPGMLEEAKRALAATGNPAAEQFAFRQVDAQEIPFPDASFDAVVANHMLYHVPDRSRAIGEIRRVLKPGGVFFAATNGEGHMTEQWQLGEEFVQMYGLPTADWHGTVGRTFSLENGAAQIGEYFDHVDVLLYEDALHVTEVEPLLRYLYSMNTLPLERENELRAFLQQKMDAGGGAIDIGKATGLFVAK
jgi:SAM-dependent methyltransferase